MRREGSDGFLLNQVWLSDCLKQSATGRTFPLHLVKFACYLPEASGDASFRDQIRERVIQQIKAAEADAAQMPRDTQFWGDDVYTQTRTHSETQTQRSSACLFIVVQAAEEAERARAEAEAAAARAACSEWGKACSRKEPQESAHVEFDVEPKIAPAGAK